MSANEELVRQLRKTIGDRPEVAEAYLFGSHARGEEQDHSDVDVAVYLSEEPDTPYGYDAELAAELMRFAGANRVDVVILNRAPPLLYHRVLRDGVRLFARNLRETTTREGRVLSRYFDFALQLEKVEAAAVARAKRGDFGH